MRVVFGALLVVLLAACETAPMPSLVTQCSEPRPQVCTMEYNPVCAEMKAGGRQQYSSWCNACADDAVSGYLAGECPE